MPEASRILLNIHGPHPKSPLVQLANTLRHQLTGQILSPDQIVKFGDLTCRVVNADPWPVSISTEVVVHWPDCPTCSKRVQHPATQHTDIQFVKDLETGVIQHINQTAEGRPVYIWTGLL
jgi:hypothetical protein